MDTRVQSGLRLSFSIPRESHEVVRMDTRVQSGLRPLLTACNSSISSLCQNGYPRSERIKTW